MDALPRLADDSRPRPPPAGNLAMVKRLAAALVVAVVGLWSCSDLSGLAGGGEGAPDGSSSSESGTSSDAAVTVDAGGLGDAVAPITDGGIEAADCPGTAGPTPVRVGSYCIDRTEVTNAQYASFVAFANAAPPKPTVECAWNTSFTPNYGWPASGAEQDLPVVGIDWCDAFAFCRWAGKRLCGAIGGGSVAAADGNDATRDQWYRVCSGAGVRGYPYGIDYDAGACNGASNARSNVGSHPGCVPIEHPGVFDLSGNVAEWEDLCTPVGPAQADTCRVRGGSNDDSPTALACTSTFEPRRDYAIALIGFRCCSP
jgi:formylglycine-generating enzyme required for sulfatase activity